VLLSFNCKEELIEEIYIFQDTFCKCILLYKSY